MLNTSRYIACTFTSNYPEFPDSCFFLQLTARKYVGQVLADGAHIYIEELAHLPLTEPHCLALYPNINSGLIGMWLVDNNGVIKFVHVTLIVVKVDLYLIIA